MSDSNGAGAGLTTDELRAAVRSVLRDVLPSATTATGADVEVTLRTDADLDAFVRRVAALCEDAAQRAELRNGRRRFRLASGAGAAASAPPAVSGSVLRFDRGAVTERAVKKAAADGVRLVVGRRAVLTPLARDKARSLGVVIEKES
jgi:catechol 2,3-dioxygenase-like lactoylglutathione lyase family enzyme